MNHYFADAKPSSRVLWVMFVEPCLTVTHLYCLSPHSYVFWRTVLYSPANCLWHLLLPIQDGMWAHVVYIIYTVWGKSTAAKEPSCHIIESTKVRDMHHFCAFLTMNHIPCKYRGVTAVCQRTSKHPMVIFRTWSDPTVEVLSKRVVTTRCPHRCPWAAACEAQHDSGLPYRPATLTLPFSTSWTTERASLFSCGLVTSTQDHASISNSLPNNQGLWWSLIPSAYVVFT